MNHIVLRYDNPEIATDIAQQLADATISENPEATPFNVAETTGYRWNYYKSEDISDVFVPYNEFVMISRIQTDQGPEYQAAMAELFFSEQRAALDNVDFHQTESGAGLLESYPDPDPDDIVKYTIPTDPTEEESWANKGIILGNFTERKAQLSYINPTFASRIWDTGVEAAGVDASVVYRLENYAQAQHLFGLLNASMVPESQHFSVVDLSQGIPNTYCVATTETQCVLHYNNYVAVINIYGSDPETQEDVSQQLAAQYVMLQQAPQIKHDKSNPAWDPKQR